MLVKKIGETIKKRRKELKITQIQVAEQAKININTLYKLERGLTNPTLEVLGKLLEVLEMKIELSVKNDGEEFLSLK
ncbi:MAG: helix-turn-helix domain-containing protein [Bacteroidales bacterium]|jgi:transcriptional regulator with XRE-family HTH domain|nr:helix-turn-helix domain-containing protein [Bacteroidales bacterium]